MGVWNVLTTCLLTSIIEAEQAMNARHDASAIIFFLYSSSSAGPASGVVSVGFFSMIAQLYASVGLQVAIRNLGPLVALPVETWFNEPIVADKWTWGSMFVILGGVIMYVSESIQEQNVSELAAGILLMLLNLVIALLERLYQRRLIAIEPVDLSKTSMLLLNNVGAILPVSALLLIPGTLHETDIVSQYWNASRTPVDYVLLVISCITGVAIGWTAINAQQYVTATTMLLITNLNKVVVVIIGAIFMAEPHGPLAMTGIAIALAGGVGYGFARSNVVDKLKQEKEAAKAVLDKGSPSAA